MSFENNVFITLLQCGDDLRQEQLAAQLLFAFQEVQQPYLSPINLHIAFSPVLEARRVATLAAAAPPDCDVC